MDFYSFLMRVNGPKYTYEYVLAAITASYALTYVISTKDSDEVNRV